MSMNSAVAAKDNNGVRIPRRRGDSLAPFGRGADAERSQICRRGAQPEYSGGAHAFSFTGPSIAVAEPMLLPTELAQSGRFGVVNQVVHGFACAQIGENSLQVIIVHVLVNRPRHGELDRASLDASSPH